MITCRKSAWLAFGLLAMGCCVGTATLASGRAVPASALPDPLVQQVQMQGLLDLFSDDDDGYAHDRHYDFDQYRNSTSRKERVRDYYRMQKDVQKDYWKGQKEMQKNAIKRQRGW